MDEGEFKAGLVYIESSRAARATANKRAVNRVAFASRCLLAGAVWPAASASCPHDFPSDGRLPTLQLQINHPSLSDFLSCTLSQQQDTSVVQLGFMFSVHLVKTVG